MVADLAQVRTMDIPLIMVHQVLVDVVVDQADIVMVVIEAVVLVIKDLMVEELDHNIIQVVEVVLAPLEQAQQIDPTEVLVD
jgi:hypothetical protein